MNNQQKAQVAELRSSGMSFLEISQRTNISVSTIKSYCYRHSISEVPRPANQTLCPQCGRPVPIMRFKPRRFCSDECRAQYWHHHPNELNRRKTEWYCCRQCGKQFPDYAGRGRKYCSHPCYIAARYGGEQRG